MRTNYLPALDRPSTGGAKEIDGYEVRSDTLSVSIVDLRRGPLCNPVSIVAGVGGGLRELKKTLDDALGYA